jgi:hypothetical protein
MNSDSAARNYYKAMTRLARYLRLMVVSMELAKLSLPIPRFLSITFTRMINIMARPAYLRAEGRQQLRSCTLR